MPHSYRESMSFRGREDVLWYHSYALIALPIIPLLSRIGYVPGDAMPFPPLLNGHGRSSVKGRIQTNTSKILVYNPAFFKYVHDKWTEHHGRYSSTGSLVVLFAVHVCDEVDLYGFGPNKHGNWNHYWVPDSSYHGAYHKATGVHDSDFEHLMLEKLHSEGIITIHRGNTD